MESIARHYHQMVGLNEDWDICRTGQCVGSFDGENVRSEELKNSIAEVIS